MALTSQQKNKIKEKIRGLLKLEERIEEKRTDMLNGDTSPFLISLLGARTTLLAKVVQSLQTTMGMSFYEQTCKILGEQCGYRVENQKKVLGHLSADVEEYLKKLNRMGYQPDRKRELDEIREISRKNAKRGKAQPREYPDSTVDVYIFTPSGEEILIDITTVKPNKKETRVMKEKLLRWAAYRMSQDPDVKCNPYFAIPYNPEASNILDTKYQRWGDYYDRADLLVGNELWSKVSGGTCSIKDIESAFSDIGNELGNFVESSLRRI